MERTFSVTLNCPDPDTVFHKEHFFNRSATQLHVNMDPVSEEEISKASQRLKNGKAVGADGVSAELLKNDGQVVVQKLTNLCNEVWYKRTVPQDWKTALLFLYLTRKPS